MMNTQIKQKWVDALRSGEYSQGTGRRRTVEGFCCLGVLCDIYAKEHNEDWKFNGFCVDSPEMGDNWYFKEESETLPSSVVTWAGLDTNDPSVVVDSRYYELSDELSMLNDKRYNFEELATFIEYGL